MSEPLAYLITWTTYGTWLPGDDRGWVRSAAEGVRQGDASIRTLAASRLKQAPVILNAAQRTLVEETIRKHCEIRNWDLHAVNVRTNHVHVVVTADLDPAQVMGQFKAWCARGLNEQAGHKQEWWTKNGSTKWINDDRYLENAIRYVMEGQ